MLGDELQDSLGLGTEWYNGYPEDDGPTLTDASELLQNNLSESRFYGLPVPLPKIISFWQPTL